ncbi:MAG TPA: DUF4199 domain-containing protein [Bacteroidia bacterium]|nr:DUF4199 domain-containing protein [Bacteroidia bacterium]HRS58092.1 DUF4199 domain-containing protein [Bacteroidia bacterium]HRU66887.1 DUF4199 domain-containing protein [Bacteroidia bacterium]
MSGIIIKYGIIGGLIAIVGTLVSYTLSDILFQKLLLNSLIQLIFFALQIYVAVRAVREIRSINGGMITFKDSFASSLGVLFILSVISIAFSLLLFNVIDKNYAEKTKLAVMESMEQRFEKYPIDEDKKLEILESYEKRDFSFTPAKAGKSLGTITGVSIIIALIIAWSIKKDISVEPENA